MLTTNTREDTYINALTTLQKYTSHDMTHQNAPKVILKFEDKIQYFRPVMLEQEALWMLAVIHRLSWTVRNEG